MRPHRPPDPEESRRARAEVVAFLRAWLPDEAKRAYRSMIRGDPENWSRDAHFAGGLIVRHALRGNGIHEPDLETSWPELLAEAVGVDDP